MVLRLKEASKYDLEYMDILSDFTEGSTIIVDLVDKDGNRKCFTRKVKYSKRYNDLYFIYDDFVWLYSMFE